MSLFDSDNEFQINNASTDTIHCVKFDHKSNQFLLSASSDSTVRLHDLYSNRLCSMFDHPAPVLNCAFEGTNRVWTGGFDRKVRVFDVVKNSKVTVGSHEGAIRCVEYSPDNCLMITAGWDGLVKLWDCCAQQLIRTYSQPDKVYSIDVCGDLLIVATVGRHVVVWDVRNGGKNVGYPKLRRESSLKFQSRCIRWFKNRESYVLGSIEGRVAVEFLEPENQKKKFAFKCHRSKTESGEERIYPVNAISIHPGYNTFATGGSDGFVNIWDAFCRKRLCQFHKYPTSIASLCFSPDGSHLAVACSYHHELCETTTNIPDSSIFIRTVSDQEVKPK